MVYKNNFIVVVKCGGKVLREQGGEVRLPFGSEYSILLKNKDSRKAVASISIDGESVTDGRIVVDGFSEVELVGFLEGMSVRNKFKFIQKTEEIVKHRGDRVDDGIVTVEYWFEERVEVTKKYEDVYVKKYINPWYTDQGSWTPQPYRDTTITCSSDISSCSPQTTTRGGCFVNSCVPTQDEGITVKGSETRQDFQYGSTKTLESQSNVINIVLKGYTDSGIKVEKFVATTDKVKCPTCGRTAKSNSKYCANCGTYLL